MRVWILVRIGAAAAFAILTVLAPGIGATSHSLAQTPPILSSGTSVFATGLEAPRGLRFGPDGNLYVAEAGLGGSQSTAALKQSAAGPCQQVVPPVGPYTGGYTARISSISPKGVRTTVIDGLPSSTTAPGGGSSVLGVSDVEFIGSNLYALLAGSGCSHGIVDVPNSLIRVNPDGTWVIVANLSKFQQANPVATPDPADFEPDGTWYSMVNVGGNLYTIEPNHSEIDKISPVTTQVSRIVDMSALPWIGPVSITYHNGNFYVGTLGEFPVTPGTEKIFQITPDGKVSTYATGLSTVLGVAFDSQGRLYALESMTAPGFPGPQEVGTGQVVRVTSSGTLETIATGLSFPTAMTFGPDGQLYVSNFGFGVPGAGQIVRIQIPS